MQRTSQHIAGSIVIAVLVGGYNTAKAQARPPSAGRPACGPLPPAVRLRGGVRSRQGYCCVQVEKDQADLKWVNVRLNPKA